MLEVLDAPAVDDAAATATASRVDRQARGPAPDVPLSERGGRTRSRMFRSRSSRARPSRSSGPPARASPRSSTCCRACTSRRPARCSSTGVDVRTLPLANLRRAMGVVPQEPFLFSDTVGGNIAFGVDEDWRVGTPAIRSRTRPRPPASRRTSQGFTDGLRHGRRRARHHALGRPEAARRDRARPRGRSAHPRARRRAVGRRHGDRGGDPPGAAGRASIAHVPHRLAPRLDGPRRATRFSCSSRAASSSAARTTTWSPPAASTPTCIGGSYWRQKLKPWTLS